MLALSLAISAPVDARESCDTFGPAVVTGRIEDPRIRETSGLAASAHNPGILWLHNDSGDLPRLFAINTRGELAALYELEVSQAIDWEDMAIGPGPRSGVDYLYIGDIGDNAARRSHVTIHRVEEPLIDQGKSTPEPRTLGSVTSFHLRYPDGAQNAEILLSDPTSGDLIIVTKDFVAGDSGIYRFRYPHEPSPDPEKPGMLEAMGRIRFRGGRPTDIATTAGDVSPAGDRILLRTYTQTLLWVRAPQTRIEHELMKAPCPTRNVGLGLPFDQYEAIAYSVDGQSYFTVSEGDDQLIYRFDLEDRHEKE